MKISEKYYIVTEKGVWPYVMWLFWRKVYFDIQVFQVVSYQIWWH